MLVFVVQSIQTFFVTLYYGYKLPKNSLVLIWEDRYERNCTFERDFKFYEDINKFKDDFEYYIIKNPYIKKHRIIDSINNTFVYGRFFDFGHIGKFFKKNAINIKQIFTFADSYSLPYKIIQKYGAFENNRYKIPITYIEEGMSAYADKVVENMHNKKNFKNTLCRLWNGIRGIKTREVDLNLMNKNVQTAILTLPNKLPNIKKNRFNVLKQNHIFNDKGFINYIFNRLNLSEILKINVNIKYILYLGSPIETNGLDIYADVDFIEKILPYLRDYEKIIIKFHHSELRTKYDRLRNNDKVIILDLGRYWFLPIEVIASKINPNLIITMVSTAGYTLLENGIKAKVIYTFPYFKMKNTENLRQVVESKNTYFLEKIEDFEEIKKKDFVDDPNIDVEDKDEDLEFMRNLLK